MTTYLHYVIDFFFLMLCTFWDFLFKKQKSSIYTVEWNAKTLKLNISKLLGMQIEPYNSKGTISFYNYPTFFFFLIILTGLNNNYRRTARESSTGVMFLITGGNK